MLNAPRGCIDYLIEGNAFGPSLRLHQNVSRSSRPGEVGLGLRQPGLNVARSLGRGRALLVSHTTVMLFPCKVIVDTMDEDEVQAEVAEEAVRPLSQRKTADLQLPQATCSLMALHDCFEHLLFGAVLGAAKN